MSKRKLFIALLVLVVALILVFVFYKTSLFSKIFNPSIPSPVPYGETSITTEEINWLKKQGAAIKDDNYAINLIKSLIRAYSEMRYSPFAIVPLEIAIIENLKTD